jgi:hypothetical protein
MQYMVAALYCRRDATATGQNEAQGEGSRNGMRSVAVRHLDLWRRFQIWELQNQRRMGIGSWDGAVEVVDG